MLDKILYYVILTINYRILDAFFGKRDEYKEENNKGYYNYRS